MTNLIIEDTIKTPSVSFSFSEGKLELKGKSIPENSIQFYEPVFSWIDNYLKQPQPSTVLNIKLEYFNTSSSKCILDLMRKLEKLNQEGNGKVEVRWYYDSDDEDMLEVGQDYESLINIPFSFHQE